MQIKLILVVLFIFVLIIKHCLPFFNLTPVILHINSSKNKSKNIHAQLDNHDIFDFMVAFTNDQLIIQTSFLCRDF